MPEPAHVTVACSIRLYGDALVRLLRRHAGFRVRAPLQRPDMLDAVSLDGRLDVLLIESKMVRGPPDPALVSLRSRFPGLCIVALQTEPEEDEIVRCVQAGVDAFVGDDASVEELIDAMRRALAGECVCPAGIAAALFQHVAGARAEDVNGRVHPTPRERDVLGLLAGALSNKAIAAQLRITPSTVKNHVHNILAKLGVATRGEAPGRARQLGWLATDRRDPGVSRPAPAAEQSADE